MVARFSRLKLKLWLSVVSVALVIGGQAWAQNSALEQEKATLVSKFAKFVNWPESAIGSEFVIGVYEDTERYEFFKSYFKNKGVNNKDISVRLITTFNEVKNVHILYVSSNKRNVLTSADKAVSGTPTLMITENNNDLNKTMIDISSDEAKSNITFKINDINIDKAGLVVPDLSYFVDDSNNDSILSIGPTYALQLKQENELLALENKFKEEKKALENRLVKQEASLNKLNEKLNESQESTEKYNADLKASTERLNSAQDQMTKLSQEIGAKDAQLQSLEEQLKALQENKSLVVEDNAETPNENLQALNENAIAQEKAIAELTESLKKQKDIANNATAKLAKISKEKESSSSFEILFYVFVLIAIIALAVAFLMWKKAKSSALASTRPAPVNEKNSLLPIREKQLIRSENIAALGYIATDITYAVGLSLADLLEQLESNGDTKNAAALKPVVSLLDNFNLIAADQDDTEIQSFDLIAYMNKMMMLYDFEFNQSDINYNYSGESSLTIKSIPSYIALVLLNLINNSLKHGFDNNGNGKISLNVEKGANNSTKITYSDDGKGMNKATLEQVFTPFFTTRSDRGYIGVGMSTTFELVKKKLAGDIKIDSKEGKGTTVSITLP